MIYQRLPSVQTGFTSARTRIQLVELIQNAAIYASISRLRVRESPGDISGVMGLWQRDRSLLVFHRAGDSGGHPTQDGNIEYPEWEIRFLQCLESNRS
jgi:hypothetical protein